jgi:hypothetical protein
VCACCLSAISATATTVTHQLLLALLAACTGIVNVSPACSEKETLAAAAEGKLARSVVLPWQTLDDTPARLQVMSMIHENMITNNAPVSHFKRVNYSHYIPALAATAESLIYLTAATRSEYTELTSGPATLLQQQLHRPMLHQVVIVLTAQARQAEVYAATGKYAAVELPAPAAKHKGLKLAATQAEHEQWAAAVQQAKAAVRPKAAVSAVWQLSDSDVPLRQLMLLRCAVLMAPQLLALLLKLSEENTVSPLTASLMPRLVLYALKVEQVLYWQAKHLTQYKHVPTLADRVQQAFAETVEMFSVEDPQAAMDYNEVCTVYLYIIQAAIV